VTSPLGYQVLVEAARKGDEDAMAQLLVRVRPHMEAIARSYSDPSQAMESVSDIVQEAWLKAWQKLDQFQGGKTDDETLAMLLAWVGQIVRRLAINAHRDRNRQRRQAPGGGILSLDGAAPAGSSGGGGIYAQSNGSTPSAAARGEEESQLVEAALDNLPDPSDRMLLRLRFFEGISLRQIAERLDLSYDKVRERYEACLRRLEGDLASLL